MSAVPTVDPATGEVIPAAPVIDPNTGELIPAAPVIDPNTGEPIPPPPAVDPNTGEPLPPAEDVGVSIVDTELEPEDVSVTVVATCNNVLQSLKKNGFVELAALVEEVMPPVTPDDVDALFTNPSAEVTFFVPPREAAAGVLHSHEQGDMTAEEVCCCFCSP